MKRAWYLGSFALVTILLFGNGAGRVRADAGKEPSTGQTPNILFDHLAGKSKIFTLDLRDRETFVVRITHTCPDAFDYLSTGIERGETTRTESEKALAELSDKDIEIVHDARFGGYVINITPKAGVNAADVCKDGGKLAAASFIVSVRESDFGISFSGGFTISGLTNPVFSINTEGSAKKVVEEPDKQDLFKLGAASFVHAFHDKVKIRQLGDLQPALAFGLGINSDNRAEYLIGGGLRLGDKATINVGKVWGAVSRLPNGIALNDPVTDDNALNNLGTKVVSRWFFALTYSFIDTKSRLLKPFAEAAASAAAAPAPAAPASPAPGTGISESLQSAIKQQIKDSATYAAVEKLRPLLGTGGTVTVCGSEVESAGGADKTELKVTAHVKGATEEDKKVLTDAAGLAAAAITTKANAAGLKIKIKSLVFNDQCAP